MIWLAWRRQRFLLLSALGASVVLVVWMVLVAHWYQDASPALAHSRCLLGSVRCQNLYDAVTSATTQATVIAAVLYAAPCLVGIILGGPLGGGRDRAQNQSPGLDSEHLEEQVADHQMGPRGRGRGGTGFGVPTGHPMVDGPGRHAGPGELPDPHQWDKPH